MDQLLEYAVTKSSLPRGILVRAEQPGDREAVERIVLQAFGPGRFAKTAERLREAARLAAGIIACQDDRVIGSVRLWRISIGTTPCLFLGPIAVERSERSEGVGAALVEACIEVASEGILLVGDAPYFGRFGFTRIDTVSMPGPVDPARVLWRPGRTVTVEGNVRAA